MKQSFNLYFEELNQKNKKEFLDIEGILKCDKCGHETKNTNKKFYLVKKIINGLPDAWLYCEKCLKESTFTTTKEEYEKKMKEWNEEVKEKGGCYLDLFDLF